MKKIKNKKVEPHYPHPFDPKNRATIHLRWQEVRQTKCPIPDPNVKEKLYLGDFIEYSYINKKGKLKHVSEYCLLVTWLEEK